jgi:outer membrane lipoprotein-sorting protein
VTMKSRIVLTALLAALGTASAQGASAQGASAQGASAQGASAQGAQESPAEAASASADITTADAFFAEIAERYAQIQDYEGKISITTDKYAMTGAIAFKAPNLLRIDFTQPAGQVISYDGAVLAVYIPEYRAILQQQISDKPGAASAKLATAEGLKTMKRSYFVAYESVPDPLPIAEGSSEKAVRLLLNRRSVAEGFKTLTLFVNPDTLLIRRMVGITLGGDEIAFDFERVSTNIGIPAARFVYESPASANVYNNFLFKSED